LATPGHIGSVDLHQACNAVFGSDREELPGVEFSDNFHRSLGDRGKPVSHVGGDDHHIAGTTPTRLVAYRHVDLAGQDAQDLLAVMEMSWSALTSAESASGENDAMKPVATACDSGKPRLWFVVSREVGHRGMLRAGALSG
jgi:hypothetical protein